MVTWYGSKSGSIMVKRLEGLMNLMMVEEKRASSKILIIGGMGLTVGLTEEAEEAVEGCCKEDDEVAWTVTMEVLEWKGFTQSHVFPWFQTIGKLNGCGMDLCFLM